MMEHLSVLAMHGRGDVYRFVCFAFLHLLLDDCGITFVLAHCIVQGLKQHISIEAAAIIAYPPSFSFPAAMLQGLFQVSFRNAHLLFIHGIKVMFVGNAVRHCNPAKLYKVKVGHVDAKENKDDDPGMDHELTEK